MKKIIVTGGYGFIGSNFIQYMFEKYPELHIVNIDRMSIGSCGVNISQPITTSKRYVNYIFDIANSEKMKTACRMHPDVDAIVNFAAETHVDRSLTDRLGFVHSNVAGVQSIIDAVVEFNVPKLLHVSTDEVYGPVLDFESKESDRLCPTNPYAASKAAAEMMINAAIHSFGINAITTRSTNNYGPQQFTEKLIPKTIINALRNKPIPVYNNGEAVREWIYVMDNCFGLELALTKGMKGTVYNIGSGMRYNVFDTVNLILAYLEKPKSLIKFTTDRINDDRRYALDSRRAEQDLGWYAQTTFTDGIEQTIEWYKEKYNL